MRKVAVIGAGGINSWVIKHLHDVVKIFDKDEMIYVKLFDKDEVEEKNLKRVNQNFEIEDLMQQKAVTLGKRFGFDFEVTFIEEDSLSKLEQFDDIIMGVDNHKTRRMIYKYCIEKQKYLLDLRAQGTQMSFYILDTNKTIEYYDKKMFNNEKVMDKKGSCQLQVDIENDHIENGNKIIAFFAVYGIYFKHLRGEDANMNEWRIAY